MFEANGEKIAAHAAVKMIYTFNFRLKTECASGGFSNDDDRASTSLRVSTLEKDPFFDISIVTVLLLIDEKGGEQHEFLFQRKAMGKGVLLIPQ